MNIQAIGKALDQPVIISKLKKNSPKILSAAALAFGVYDTFKAPKEERAKRGVKNAIILSATVAISLLSAFGLKAGGKQIFNGLVNLPSEAEILEKNKTAIDNFLKKNSPNESIKAILNKAKSSPLNPKETEALLNDSAAKNSKELLDTLFSKKNNLNSKEIFEETGRLSVLGLAPVAAGVVSGIAADKITNDYTPEGASKKIKEGAYQFLANIFMCNVGAAGALFGAEKLASKGVIKSLTPMKKLGIIMGGIFLTGIMGGSVVANLIGKKILDPIFDKKSPKSAPKSQIENSGENVFGKNFPNAPELAFQKLPQNAQKGGLYDERKPEPLDLALHVDDIATAGVLSGFKWIEPMLPLTYTISGYRAGIGYRNGEK